MPPKSRRSGRRNYSFPRTRESEIEAGEELTSVTEEKENQPEVAMCFINAESETTVQSQDSPEQSPELFEGFSAEEIAPVQKKTKNNNNNNNNNKLLMPCV